MGTLRLSQKTPSLNLRLGNSHHKITYLAQQVTNTLPLKYLQYNRGLLMVADRAQNRNTYPHLTVLPQP